MSTITEQECLIITARTTEKSMSNIPNFRDFGDAHSNLQKNIVFRSSMFFGPEIRQIYGIKKILDLRHKCEKSQAQNSSIYCIWTDPKLCDSNNTNLKDDTIKIDFISISVGLYIISRMPSSLIWKLFLHGFNKKYCEKIMCPAIADPDILGFAELYIIFLEKSGDKIAQCIRLFADKSNYPILVHCIHGKDRTGIIFMLLMMLCNIPHEIIASDFAVSEKHLKKFKDLTTDKEILVHLEHDNVLRADRKDIIKAMDHVINNYGDIKTYLRSIGITDSEMTSIRCNLLKK